MVSPRTEIHTLPGGERDVILEFLSRLSFEPGELRKGVVRLASDVFGLRRSIFWLIDERGEIYDPVCHGVDGQTIEAYICERHYRTDMFHPHNLDPRLLVGRNVLRVEDLLSRECFESSPYYRRFLAPHHVRHLLSVFFAKGGRLYGGLGVPRGEEEQPFTLRDVRVLEAVARQVTEVLALTEDLSAAHRRSLCFECFAESTSAGLAVLDDDGTVLYANPAAARLCTSLRSGAPSSTPVHHFVARLLETRPRSWREGFTALTFSSELARLRVRLVPAFEPTGGHAARRYTLTVESADAAWLGRGRPGPRARLTARERTVLDLVVAGWTNEQIAAELVVSVHTVKKHVQHLLRKFGVTNRTSLAFAAGPLAGR
jgi:DNA-binding CsgD family transcriptional regulator/PAS domain-containing protein